MIKLVLSLLLISAQAIASTPCPTCKKGYVASSLEEVLIARQKAKGLDLKKTPDGKKSTQEKSHVTNIIMNRAPRDAFRSPVPSSYFSKRNEILGTIDASPPSQTGGIYPSLKRDNQNLRGTFDRTMTFGMQQQSHRALQATQKNSSFKF